MPDLDSVSKLTRIKVEQLRLIRKDGYYYSNRLHYNATKHLLNRKIITPVFDSSGKKVRGVYFVNPMFMQILENWK